jgi:hypothetical protein
MKFATLALSVAILAHSVMGHALSGGPVDGQVLDYDTGQPVTGAFVVAKWGGSLLSGQSICVHVETTVSDERGRYHIGTWSQQPPALVFSAALTLDVYKTGQESTSSPLFYVGYEGKTWVVFHRDRPNVVLQTFRDEESARRATHPTNIYVKRFVGTQDERIRYLRGSAFAGIGCDGGGASQRNLYPLQKAAFQEAKALATTAEHEKLLKNMRAIAKTTWLALPPNAPDPEPLTFPDQFLRDFQ